MQLTVILSMIFAIIVAIFAGLNSNVVQVNLLFIKPEMSLAIIILISAISGAAIMYLLNIFKTFKKSKEIKNLTKIIDKKDIEIKKLNNEIKEKDIKIEEIKKIETTKTEKLEGKENKE